MASCRKQSQPDGYFGDIAVIQHNLNSGATCFYQALGELNGDVKAPSKGNGADGWGWLGPAQTAGIDCAGCHDNGPLMRSPYVAQIEGPDALPSAGDDLWNSEGDPYWFVGEDFDDWKTYSVEVTGNACTSCHRMGTSNLSEPSVGVLGSGRGSAGPAARGAGAVRRRAGGCGAQGAQALLAQAT